MTVTPPVPVSPEVVRRLAEVVGARHCLSDPVDLRTYECDGLASTRVAPGVVVLPGSTAEVAGVLRIAREARLPVVPRGAGTGLSGGALPVAGGVVVGLSRMRRVLEVDLDDGWVRVEAGVANLDVTKRVGPDGAYYAPDPSSQSVCTVGGNVAENAGGAHCLKYGFTLNHVLGVRAVLADGSVVDVGGPVLDPPGYDLLALLVGSEGTVAIVTEVVLRLLRRPEATRTLLAVFDTARQAGEAVSAVIASGIVPSAVEMMDRLAIQAAKAATGLDWPDVGAVLLVDVDGPGAEAAHTAERCVAICEEHGASEVRIPRDDAERALMWKGRKSAFAAVGRISPSYLVQDGVIPRSKIAAVLEEVAAMAEAAGLRVANVFHAGDGNLHPLVLFDARVAGEEAKAEALAGEILRLCVRSGGSITGEHGVGADKLPFMAEMFTEDDLETMRRLRVAFDPSGLLNPGKALPAPRLCGEGPRTAGGAR